MMSPSVGTKEDNFFSRNFISFIIFFQAIDSQQRGQYMVKVISPVINADDDKVSLRSIPLISMLHNFKFTDNGLQVWRAYDIGQGNIIL